MCGIAGLFEFGRDAHVDSAVLRRMCDVMAHRGPDDNGIFTQGKIGLGMRRLSIIDLATGHQPRQQRRRLDLDRFQRRNLQPPRAARAIDPRGHRYRTHSDTETIVHLYEEYGKDCVQHLRGMFAFAIWDAKHKSLFIARDRLGIKPLYYRRSSRNFLFGSEIKVLLAHPEVRPEFNRAALPEYSGFRLSLRRRDFLHRRPQADARHTAGNKRARRSSHRTVLGLAADSRGQACTMRVTTSKATAICSKERSIAT